MARGSSWPRRRPGLWLPAAAAILSAAAAVSCAPGPVGEARRTVVADIDPGSVADGAYGGQYTLGGFTYAVAVRVRNHRIAGVAVLNVPGNAYGRRARQVAPRVLEQQTPRVDAISGATVSSTGLLKAVEAALRKGLGKGT